MNELRHQLDSYKDNASKPGVLELRLSCEEVPPFTPFLPDNIETIPFYR
jgi:hypothetical protein